MTTPFRSRPRLRSLAAPAAVAAALALTACGGSSDAVGTDTSGGGTGDPNASTTLDLVGYSTPETAYGALTTAFSKTAAGRGVGFANSWGSSGSQSRAVGNGQPADVVAFSTEPDMDKLVDSKIVGASWNHNPEHGFSCDSVVVLVVRKGNPKHITGWSSLLKPGVTVLTPNPETSGSARWNMLAAYGAMLKQGRSRAQATAYVRQLVTRHVKAEDSSASTALEDFTGGEGDVLLDYESDAIAAERAGEKVSYVVPRQTILIQTPIAATARAPAQARAFVRYQWSTAGQTVWAKQGYRPVDPAVARRFATTFPTPPQLFTIGYLGGWTTAGADFKSGGFITKIEQEAGFPTASS
jgi:sulfate/thiosulfate transport system substrate-binding protein